MKAVLEALRQGPNRWLSDQGWTDERHRAYVRALVLWYFYMRVAASQPGDWDERGVAVRPADGESLNGWFERLWPDLEPSPTYAVQVRSSPEQMEWDDSVREVHVTINLDSYPKSMLMAELGAIIDARISSEMKSAAAEKRFVVFRAYYQPNAEMTKELVASYLRALRVIQMRTGTLEQKGARVRPGSDPDDQKAYARDALKRGKEALVAVRSGRFPYLDRPPFARWFADAPDGSGLQMG